MLNNGDMVVCICRTPRADVEYTATVLEVQSWRVKVRPLDPPTLYMSDRARWLRQDRVKIAGKG